MRCSSDRHRRSVRLVTVRESSFTEAIAFEMIFDGRDSDNDARNLIHAKRIRLVNQLKNAGYRYQSNKGGDTRINFGIQAQIKYRYY